MPNHVERIRETTQLNIACLKAGLNFVSPGFNLNRLGDIHLSMSKAHGSEGGASSSYLLLSGRFIYVSPLRQFAPWMFRPKTFRPWCLGFN